MLYDVVSDDRETMVYVEPDPPARGCQQLKERADMLAPADNPNGDAIGRSRDPHHASHQEGKGRAKTAPAARQIAREQLGHPSTDGERAPHDRAGTIEQRGYLLADPRVERSPLRADPRGNLEVSG